MNPDLTPEEIATQYDRIGEDYVREQARFVREHGDFATDFLLKAIKRREGGALLDVGCGAGDQLLLYSEMFDARGIDPSWEMVKVARKKLGERGGKVQRGTAGNIFYRGDSIFDVVASRFSLNYAEDLDDAWKEIGRVVKPGGVLAYTAPHPFTIFRMKGDKGYDDVEQVTCDLFGGAVPVTNYSHSFQDYFSPAFFERFTVEEFNEFLGVAGRAGDYGVPSAFGVKARRRE